MKGILSEMISLTDVDINNMNYKLTKKLWLRKGSENHNHSLRHEYGCVYVGYIMYIWIG